MPSNPDYQEAHRTRHDVILTGRRYICAAHDCRFLGNHVSEAVEHAVRHQYQHGGAK